VVCEATSLYSSWIHVVDVLDMHFASVFMAEVISVGVHVYVGFDPTGRRGKRGADTRSWPVGIVDREMLSNNGRFD
jgi:hypothetical protein